MSHSDSSKKSTPLRLLFDYSLFLIFGAIAALVWANLDQESHYNVFHADLVALVTGAESEHGDGHEGDSHEAGDGHTEDGHTEDGHTDDDHEDDGGDVGNGAAGAEEDGTGAGDENAEDEGAAGENSTDESSSGAAVAGDDHSDEGGSHGHSLNLHFIINDILMALFFAIAGKEVWESLLPGGALSNPRKAATPLLATLGGIVGPAGIYVLGVFMFGDWASLGNGWAIPCATDIAFSYLVARLIFGQGHPAIAFLLLLAIADDAAGLMIIALFYSSDIQPLWLALTLVAMAIGMVMHKKLRLQNFWWYLLIPGVLSWLSFYKAGIHPALGLVPIIPIMPHAHTDLGMFAREEMHRDDTLNAFEHWWKNPVEVILGLFGLCNAGVAFSSAGTATWLVLAGLLLGKPLGITLFTLIAEKGFRLEVPRGMGYREIVTLGCIAGIGFTVALFVSGVAFPQGTVLDAAKMGALASFGAAFLSFAVAKVLRVKPWNGEDVADSQSETSESGAADVHRNQGENLGDVVTDVHNASTSS